DAARMLALGAEVEATGPKGKRTIPVASFFKGLFTTALEPNEILTEIRIPVPAARSGGAYVKLERKVGDFATAGAAAFVVVGPSGGFQFVGVGLTNAGLTPVKPTKAELYLTGKKTDAIPEAARLAAEGVSPGADRRGSTEYKREMARVLTKRALKKAYERAGGR